MADRRAQLATRVRDTLAEALGATRTRLSAAQAELTAGRERLARVRRAAAAVPERVGGQRDRRLAEIDARHATPHRRAGRRAADAAGREAPGAAGAAVARLAAHARPPGRAARRAAGRHGPDRRRRPGAGAGAAARRRARGAVRRRPRRLRRRGGRRCCCGPSAAPTPGAVRLIGYDPEHLGGGLAGFAPLGTAGAAHLRRAGRAGPGCWTTWSSRSAGSTRRCWPASTARCASWPPRPAAGPSRGGWRCCSAATS